MPGKSLDELKLRPEPTSPAKDPRDTDWYRFIERIESLIAQGRVTFALDTLEAIKTTVEQSQRVSPGQIRAVDNIEDAAYRSRAARSGRRWEGA